MVPSSASRSLLSVRELAERGVSREMIRLKVKRGELIPTARGIYTPADQPVSAHHTFAAVARRFPQGVLCLLSALRFHDFTTQQPGEIWLALPKGARIPRDPWLRLRVIRLADTKLRSKIY